MTSASLASPSVSAPAERGAVPVSIDHPRAHEAEADRATCGGDPRQHLVSVTEATVAPAMP